MLPWRRILTHRRPLLVLLSSPRTMSTFLSLADITPPRLPPIRPTNSSAAITLTPDEDRLCTLLDECTKSLKETRPDLAPIECRIAGGWVRDKVRAVRRIYIPSSCVRQLLGKESNDIDIALSSIMGIAFAELFVPYLEERGIAIRSLAKIASNPEQSKHLETCRATILGLEIDFVNLRSEEYADGSRIPTQIVRLILHLWSERSRQNTEVRHTARGRSSPRYYNKRSFLQRPHPGGRRSHTKSQQGNQSGRSC